jgi:hypothetical protein
MLCCLGMLITSSPALCRSNDLGAEGVEGLVKGNWPELRLLDIRWGLMAWLLYM